MVVVLVVTFPAPLPAVILFSPGKQENKMAARSRAGNGTMVLVYRDDTEKHGHSYMRAKHSIILLKTLLTINGSYNQKSQTSSNYLLFWLKLLNF